MVDGIEKNIVDISPQAFQFRDYRPIKRKKLQGSGSCASMPGSGMYGVGCGRYPLIFF